MANTIIQLRHSTIQGNVPVSLANGEISINTRDGKIFYAQPDGTIVEFSGFTGPSGLNGEIQFNDSGVLGADPGLTYNKTTDILTVVGGAIIGGVNVAPQIQLAYNHANAAFEAANTGGGGDGTDQYARDTANAAFIAANTPSHVANSAAIYANSAFIHANSTFEFANGVSIAANTPSQVANSAFIQANAAFDHANSAFNSANNALDTWVRGQANAAFDAANTADQKAVTSGVYANAAFDAANTADQKAVTSGVYANAAFVRANNALNANVGGTIDGDVIITGNLIVQGTEFITQTDSLAIHDNMIYLNNPIAANVANAVGNGTHVIYTTDITHGYDVGMGITVSDVTPNSFNISGTSNTLIGAVTSNTFTVVSSVTDTYVSGGTARARTSLNPDLGFAGGYYTTSYAHAGLFRDASDGIWKFFHNYTPEPDTSPYINTNDPSFRIADLTANIITNVISVRGIDPLHQANAAFETANIEAGVNATQNTNIQFAWNHANAAFEAANTSGGGETVTVSTFNATANGAQTTFEIGFTPVSAEAVQVTIDGLVQPETSYTADANANTITFLTAPANGEQVRVISFYTNAETYFYGAASINPDNFSTETNNFINLTATSAASIEASAIAVALAIALG